MNKTNTGGPAFPSGLKETDTDTVESLHTGMTLRDYFAAKALPTVIADWLQTGDIFPDMEIAEVIARDCYIVADAMLKASAAAESPADMLALPVKGEAT